MGCHGIPSPIAFLKAHDLGFARLRTGVHAMKRSALLMTVFATVFVLVIPFVGGSGTGPLSAAIADDASNAQSIASLSVSAANSSGARATASGPTEESIVAARAAATESLSQDSEHLAQKPVPAPAPVVAVEASGGGGAAGSAGTQSGYQAEAQGCPGDAGGGVGGAPGSSSGQGVAGTTSDDLASFAYQYNAIRVANCLQPIPYGNFYYDSCMEARLFWMAESPSTDPLDAWGHMGSVRSDGVPSNGCDGNLAGGSDNSGATVAQKWWDSYDHRVSLYRPDSGVDGACIAFAMSHGGIDEPYSFTRSAARWTSC